MKRFGKYDLKKAPSPWSTAGCSAESRIAKYAYVQFTEKPFNRTGRKTKQYGCLERNDLFFHSIAANVSKNQEFFFFPKADSLAQEG